MSKRFVGFAALALCAGLAATQSGRASAQPYPAPTPIDLPTVSPQTNMDPTVRAAHNAAAGIIRAQQWRLSNQSEGDVTYFKRFEMQIRTGSNAYRAVHLHHGTVINPRGASIQVGSHVQVGGDNQGDGSLNANVITITN